MACISTVAYLVISHLTAPLDDLSRGIGTLMTPSRETSLPSQSKGPATQSPTDLPLFPPTITNSTLLFPVISSKLRNNVVPQVLDNVI